MKLILIIYKWIIYCEFFYNGYLRDIYKIEGNIELFFKEFILRWNGVL